MAGLFFAIFFKKAQKKWQIRRGKACLYSAHRSKGLASMSGQRFPSLCRKMHAEMAFGEKVFGDFMKPVDPKPLASHSARPARENDATKAKKRKRVFRFLVFATSFSRKLAHFGGQKYAVFGFTASFSQIFLKFTKKFSRKILAHRARECCRTGVFSCT